METAPAPSPANPPAASYAIGELAREFGITTRAIRHYEQLGLLRPARRGQTRIYTPADRVTLMLILRGNRLGFTLAESRELIGLYDPASGNITQLERLLAKLAERRATLQRQLADIHDMQQELDQVEQRCRDTLNQCRTDTRAAPTTRRRTRGA